MHTHIYIYIDSDGAVDEWLGRGRYSAVSVIHIHTLKNHMNHKLKINAGCVIYMIY